MLITLPGQARLYAQNPNLAPKAGVGEEAPSMGSKGMDSFDYAEAVDTTSSMSTPNSSNYWDSPFAKDSLGDTVIHLDKVFKSSFSTLRTLVQIETFIFLFFLFLIARHQYFCMDDRVLPHLPNCPHLVSVYTVFLAPTVYKQTS